MTAKDLIKEMELLAHPDRAAHSMRFFKTGKGQYGEGDQFWGLTVPEQRLLAKKYKELTLSEVSILLASPIHEQRLTALLILTLKSKKASIEEKRELYDFYLTQTSRVNNWDLVDLSAPIIVGEYLAEFPKSLPVLDQLVTSSSLWERRIAIIATLGLIRNGRFDEAIRLSAALLHDKEDLIHKASGWVLREVGKKDIDRLLDFLEQHAHHMPRTMLRYSIERLSPFERAHFMAKK